MTAAICKKFNGERNFLIKSRAMPFPAATAAGRHQLPPIAYAFDIDSARAKQANSATAANKNGSHKDCRKNLSACLRGVR
jgi:hypothetical protein